MATIGNGNEKPLTIDGLVLVADDGDKDGLDAWYLESNGMVFLRDKETGLKISACRPAKSGIEAAKDWAKKELGIDS